MPSIEDIPQFVATFWDIPLGAAEVILSVIVILAALLPVLVLTRGRSNMAIAVTFILVEGVLVGISWLDAWFMILTVVVLVLLFSAKTSDVVVGK